MDFAERAARNEQVFRGVNERIEAGAERQGPDTPMRFHCECDRESCFDTLELPAAVYRQIVEQRYHFVIAPGHQDARVERVVEEHDSYSVAEKIGEARAVLEREHPQQRHR
jgi:hypothetical protein